MTSLEWNVLTAKFYDFKKEAEMYGFYVPELHKMEESLSLMRPYQETQEMHKKTEEGFRNRTQKSDNNAATWVYAKTPEFDDNDELVTA